MALVWSNYASGKLWLWCAVLSYPARIVLIGVNFFLYTFFLSSSKRRSMVISTLENTLESIFAFKTKAKHSHGSWWTHQSHEVICIDRRQQYNVPEAVTSIHYSGTKISTEGINLIYRLTSLSFSDMQRDSILCLECY